MLKNNEFQVPSFKFQVGKAVLFCLLLTAYCLLAVGCRYDMQDQPRYEYYEKSEFFSNELSSRPIIEGTVPRGYLREDRALYTGKKDGAALAPNAISSSGGNQQTPQTQQQGQQGGQTGTATVNATYPDAVTEFPIPVTAELINRGQERYNVFCVVCHGPNGNGDGMIARRGYEGVKTYHTDELRNAPVGHFYDVITNGWGRMNGYASMIPVADRWAIIAYIRTLQASQNPDVVNPGATQQNQQTTGAQTQNRKAPNSENGAKN